MKQIKFAFLVAATALLQMAPAETTRQPNILLILSDDQRWDTLGCYGNASIRTPNLDKLAAGGARLDRLYITPLCAPSRGACAKLSTRRPTRTI